MYEITIKPELVSALEREAIIANRTSVEYIEMIMNSHLAEKKKFRLLSDIEYVGIDVVAPSVDTLRVEKEVEVKALEDARIAEELANTPVDITPEVPMDNGTSTPII